MTPIEKMDDAARRHPLLTSRLLALSRDDQKQHLEYLRRQAKEAGTTADLGDLSLIESHLEVATMSRFFR